MPVRRTVRPHERAAPYQIHNKPTAMAASVISSQPWPNMHHTTHPSGLNWQPHMQPYPLSAPLDSYSQPLATPNLTISHPPAPPPHQDRRASHSHSSSQNNDGGPWTTEMDNVLMDAQARGMRWEQISQVYFPHKSANACRKRYGRAKEERRATDWDEARIGRVIAIYNRDGFREQLWKQLASESGERWQDIEKLCYSQGLSRMVRGRGSHSRSRSRTSVGPAANDDYEQRYAPNEDYDGRDDSGIGLGLMADHSHHMPAVSQVGGPSMTSSAPIEMLIQPSHGYSYAS